MEAKLQELTNKIYAEGIEKANREAAALLEHARKEAETQLQLARREAEQILEQTRKEAGEFRRNVTAELQLASRQAERALRQRITELITTRLVGEPLAKSFDDAAFLQRIIETALQNWSPQGGARPALTLLLPPAEADRLGAYFAERTGEALNGGLQVTFDGQVDGGFRIGPADGRYVISFSEKDFERFFREYLRPRTSALLYGEN